MSSLPGMHSDKTKARALALAMHAAFIVLLVFGVSWQKKPESPVVADLWSSLPPIAQPKVEVAPEPEPEPPPRPAPRVAPPPVPKAEPAPPPNAEIAVKQKEKEKPKPAPKVESKPEPKKLDEDKIEKALRAKEEEAKKKREQERNAEIKKEKDAADAKATAAKAEMQKYIDGIKSRVQRAVVVPPNIQGNPEAEVVITLIPGGELLDVQIKKRSGNAAYDDAIERAIRRSQPFVVPSGEQFQQHFRQFTMAFRPIQ